MLRTLLLVAHLRRTAKLAHQTQAQAASGFTVDTTQIITQAQSFFNSFSGVLAVAIGIGLGGSILYKVKNLF